MAKMGKIQFDQETAALNTGVKELPLVKTTEIKVDPEVAGQLTIKDEDYNRVYESMKSRGFDDAQALKIGRLPDGTEILCDGHTRLKAALALGISYVPAKFEEFKDKQELLAETRRLQIDRRNLSTAEKYELIRRNCKTPDDASGKKKFDDLATDLGISKRTAQDFRSVANEVSESSDPEIKAVEENLKNDKESASSAAKKIRGIKAKKSGKPAGTPSTVTDDSGTKYLNTNLGRRTPLAQDADAAEDRRENNSLKGTAFDGETPVPDNLGEIEFTTAPRRQGRMIEISEVVRLLQEINDKDGIRKILDSMSVTCHCEWKELIGNMTADAIKEVESLMEE